MAKKYKTFTKETSKTEHLLKYQKVREITYWLKKQDYLKVFIVKKIVKT